MLITLVIIGVIAALTIPNLLQKYQEQTTVKKVQKFYSNLSNAYSLAIKENGNIDEWELIDANQESAKKIYELIFKPYFKIAKNCGAENTGNCVIRSSNYKALNNQDGSAGWFADPSRYKLVLDDGSAVIFSSNSTEQKLFYDINGIKAPNKYGIDTFYFTLTQNGKVIPTGMPGYTFNFNSYCNRNADSNNRSTGLGCAAWIIYKGNMDYLHCDGLTWERHSCKDK